jgi:hypothetical protein
MIDNEREGMAQIVNFKRAKKAKARAVAEEKAASNRAQFGTPKKLRDLAKARREIDTHKLDDDED